MQVYASWQILLVDLRCHGESLQHGKASLLPNTVEGAASDILDLLRHLKLFPEALIGHSFGGKVVLSMADQFGRLGPRLPRPVQVREGRTFSVRGGSRSACFFLQAQPVLLCYP